MNGRYFAGRKIECSYWDGVTDYKVFSDIESERVGGGGG